MSDIVVFLKKLVDDIENKKLSDEDLIYVSDFYMSYKAKTEKQIDYSDREFIKFFTLGWYVYTHLIPENKK